MLTTDQFNKLKEDLHNQIDWVSGLLVCKAVGVSGIRTVEDVQGMLWRFLKAWNPDPTARTFGGVGPIMVEYSPPSKRSDGTPIMTINPDGSRTPDVADYRVFFVMTSGWAPVPPADTAPDSPVGNDDAGE